MSSSSDGSDGRNPRGAPPRARPQIPHIAPQAAPETRAAHRYQVDPQRYTPSEQHEDPATSDAWQRDTDPRTGRPQQQLYDDLDPRTSPATFEFQPSPLQPQRGQQRASPSGRLPHNPDELLQDSRPSASPESDLGAFQPEPMRATPRQDNSALSAPARTQRSNREMAHAPIVPAGSVTGRSLTLVVAIMCFLACLTTGAVYLMNQSASAWLRDIASEITVQVEAREKVDIEKQVRDVATYLTKQPGIIAAKPLTLEASAGLLEPWLGQAEGLKNLPVPRMIAVEVDRLNPPDFNTLRTGLSGQFKGTTLDDHRHWQRQIRTVTRSFALGGLAILALVGAATMAIIVSATRSALASNREIVEVLHFVGATDRFIASQFQRHFLRLGIRAGIFGAVLAGLAFLAMPLVMELLGGGSASLAEMQHLVGTGTLDWPGYGWLAIVVFVIAALCMITSRIGVYRILHSQH